MKPILTLDELFDHIGNRLASWKSLESCVEIVKAYTWNDWQEYKKFSTESYVRQQLKVSESHEFVLICRSPGQGFPLHDHAQGGCIYHSLEWQILESRTDLQKKPLSVKQLMAGESVYIDNTLWYHAIANTSTQNAVTLHIYTPPGYQSQIQ